MDIIAGKKPAEMVKNQLIIVVIAVEKGTFNAPGSVSKGRGTNVQTTNRLEQKVVWAEGGT